MEKPTTRKAHDKKNKKEKPRVGKVSLDNTGQGTFLLIFKAGNKRENKSEPAIANAMTIDDYRTNLKFKGFVDFLINIREANVWNDLLKGHYKGGTVQSGILNYVISVEYQGKQRGRTISDVIDKTEHVLHPLKVNDDYNEHIRNELKSKKKDLKKKENQKLLVA